MENNVLTIEQCHELITLGMTMDDACLYWHRYHNKDNSECYGTFLELFGKNLMTSMGWEDDITPTYDLYTILRKLNTNNKHYQVCINESYNLVNLIDDNGYEPVKHIRNEQASTTLEAAFNMLKFCITNNLL